MSETGVRYTVLPSGGLSFERDDVRVLPCPATQSSILDDQCAQFILLNKMAPLGHFLARPTNYQPSAPIRFQYVVGETEALAASSPVPFPNYPKDVFKEFRESVEAFVALSDNESLPGPQRKIAEEFMLPDPRKFPEAYRIWKPSVLSQRRLFVIWGIELQDTPGAVMPALDVFGVLKEAGRGGVGKRGTVLPHPPPQRAPRHQATMQMAATLSGQGLEA